MKNIYEMPVYCGRLKEWRILNLNTGTIYSMSYETEENAKKDISVGEIRGNRPVVAVSLEQVVSCIELVEVFELK